MSTQTLTYSKQQIEDYNNSKVSLVPSSDNKFIYVDKPKDRIVKEHYKELIEKVEKHKKRLAEKGYNGINRPTAYLGAINRVGSAQGQTDGYYVDLVIFPLKGCQFQIPAIERLEKCDQVVLDHNLLSLEEIVARSGEGGAFTTMATQKKREAYLKLRNYLESRKETNKVLASGAKQVSEEVKEENTQLKKRIAELEAKALGDEKPKKKKNKGDN